MHASMLCWHNLFIRRNESIYTQKEHLFFWNQSLSCPPTTSYLWIKNRHTLTSTHYSKKKPQEEMRWSVIIINVLFDLINCRKPHTSFQEVCFRLNIMGVLLCCFCWRDVGTLSTYLSDAALKYIFSKKSDKIMHTTLY